MIFFGISILAGVFTVLAPCILPLLPVVIGASEAGERRISRRALVVIGSLSVSVIVFTLLLKASTLLIDIPHIFWSWFSGAILILVGIAIVFPSFWARIPFVNKLSLVSNKAVGTGYQKKSHAGDIAIGAALGPVFTTCSPTYLFIIATVLPATLAEGLVYLFGFVLGLAASLLLIAYFGQQLINKVAAHMHTAGRLKQIFGVLIILVGILILTGYDKKIETLILDSGYGATIQLENTLIEGFAPSMNMSQESMMNGSYETIVLDRVVKNRTDGPRGWYVLIGALVIGVLGGVVSGVLVHYRNHHEEATRIVTPDSYVRAETDTQFAYSVTKGGFGQLLHTRTIVDTEAQGIVRPNRDTLYSSGVFDLDAGVVTVVLPESKGRYISLQVISEDHDTVRVFTESGRYELSREMVGTRYVFLNIRIAVNALDQKDLTEAHALQDAITVEQKNRGTFAIPSWDEASLVQVRHEFVAQADSFTDSTNMFGSQGETDELKHKIGTAIGWGGLPSTSAMYVYMYPKENTGVVPYQLTLQDVPVDAFWSVTVYGPDGYFITNTQSAYAIQSQTAFQNRNGSITIQFGECESDVPNCLPIEAGWSYTIRFYEPRPELLSGSWNVPIAVPIPESI